LKRSQLKAYHANKRKEYMPKEWDYNEWYHGNNWRKDSKQSREFLLKQQHVDLKFAKKNDWLRDKINFVGYSGQPKIDKAYNEYMRKH